MRRDRHAIARAAVAKHGHEQSWTQRIPGGTTKPPAQFNPSSLVKGVVVELEHADDPCVAMEIAMDHLDGDPAYYERHSGAEVRNPAPEAPRARQLAGRIGRL